MKKYQIKARRDTYGAWLNLTMQSLYWIIYTRKELEVNYTDFAQIMVNHFEISVYDKVNKPFSKEPHTFAIINEEDLKYVEQFASSRKVTLFIEEYIDIAYNPVLKIGPKDGLV